jgi:spermidine synthase
MFLNIALLLLYALHLPDTAFKVIFEKESPYHRVCVEENEDSCRKLCFGKYHGVQSLVRVGHPEDLIIEYNRLAFVSFAFMDSIPRDVLAVGLGGGSIPMFIRRFFPDTHIETVEIDPVVIQAAHDYLGFIPDEKVQIFNLDGRVFLKRTTKMYDIIILDAYNDATIPFHLTTREFFTIVKNHLKPGGVVVSNVWAPAMDDFFYSMIATYRSVFDQVCLFETEIGGNLIFVASLDTTPFSKDALATRAEALMKENNLPFDLAAMVHSRYLGIPADTSKGFVLTDDHAPVDLLREGIPK